MVNANFLQNLTRLQEIFPNEVDATVQATLASCCGDINKAAAKLAGCIDEGF